MVFLSLKIDFVLANSADHDEMLHYVAFHLGLHCLPKYLFRGLQSTRVYSKTMGPDFSFQTFSSLNKKR